MLYCSFLLASLIVMVQAQAPNGSCCALYYGDSDSTCALCNRQSFECRPSHQQAGVSTTKQDCISFAYADETACKAACSHCIWRVHGCPATTTSYPPSPPPPPTKSSPFADRTALKAAVDNCLIVDANGVACCNHGADCGPAGTDEMDKWDVSQVTDMSNMFDFASHEYAFHVCRRRGFQPRHRIVDHLASHGYARHVQWRHGVQSRYRIVDYFASHEYAFHVCWCRGFQPRYRILDYIAGHRHVLHVCWRQGV